MSVFFTRRGPAPVLGKMLGDYAEGDIVYLNESGSPVEFYVAKHDYESALNGYGRTLLVRKDIYSKNYPWISYGAPNTYASSYIDSFFNGDYKTLLDSAVQDSISTTSFYYTPGNENNNVSVLSRSIFALSATELGYINSSVNTEGAALPISSTLRTAYFNGSEQSHWTRSPSRYTTNTVFVVSSYGFGEQYCHMNGYGYRPVFTLPATAKFNPDTNQFKGVA